MKAVKSLPPRRARPRENDTEAIWLANVACPGLMIVVWCFCAARALSASSHLSKMITSVAILGHMENAG